MNRNRTRLAAGGLALALAGLLLAPPLPDDDAAFKRPNATAAPAAGLEIARLQREHAAATRSARSPSRLRKAVRALAEPQAATAQPATISVQTLDTPDGPLEVVADEVIVLVRPDITPAGLERLAADTGTQVRRYDARLSLARLGFDDATDPRAVADRVSSHPLALGARPHAVMRATGTGVEVTRGGKNISVSRPGQTLILTGGSEPIGQLEPLQWNLTASGHQRVLANSASGDGICVAVLDSGVAYENYSDAKGNYKLAPDLAHVHFSSPIDVVNGDSHANDDNGHGTEMTSLIAGFGQAIALAPNAEIMPVKVLDAAQVGTEMGLVAGIDHATERGADVISMSLAFSQGYSPSPWLEAVVEAAWEAGIVMVGASGNEGADRVAYPARMRRVIAVGAYTGNSVDGATGRLGMPALASYSNGGPELDVLAPGGTLDEDRDNNGVPDGLVVQGFAPGAPQNLGWWLTAGTSPAAAIVSATVALMLENGAPADGVRQLLADSARQVIEPEDQFKWGNFNYRRGAGALDAGNAIDVKTWGSRTSGCDNDDIFVNPVGILTEPSSGKVRLNLFVEVRRASMQAVSGAVHVRLSGSVNSSSVIWTDGQGVANLMTEPFTPPAGGVRIDVEIGAVETYSPVCGWGELVARPLTFTRMDELSYRLASALGTGLASSALVVLVDPTARAAFPIWDASLYRNTYVERSFGTGLASSALVSFSDALYMQNAQRLQSVAVLRTFGSGLASSALVFDSALFSPTVLAAYQPRTLVALSYLSGTGLASSAIIVGGTTRAWSYYVPTFPNPAVISFAYGTGLASSAIILDRTLLSPTLFTTNTNLVQSRINDTSTALVAGRGLASSARVLNFNASTASLLGFNFNLVSQTTLAGTGLASSALVMGFTTQQLQQTVTLARWMNGMGLASSALIASYNPTMRLSSPTLWTSLRLNTVTSTGHVKLQ
ncbi:MAG: S8 family serine peptidase [Myxococcota bacterium]